MEAEKTVKNEKISTVDSFAQPFSGANDGTINLYRKTLNDHQSSDDDVKKRIDYIKSLCRSFIKQEVAKMRINHEKRNQKQ